jgi:hypothetical protein
MLFPIRVIREICGEPWFGKCAKAVRNEAGDRDGRPYLAVSESDA